MKTVASWESLPGGFDAVKAQLLLGTPGIMLEPEYGLPVVLDQPRASELVNALIWRHIDAVRYNERPKASPDGVVHFFIQDYLFESLWNRPSTGVATLRKYAGCFGPDFSCFPEWPDAVNLWNVYRNRLLTRYWQANGINVIPTITWGDERSYRYAFLGVPKNTSVAVGVTGLRDAVVRERFAAGLIAMMQALSPREIVWYGRIDDAQRYGRRIAASARWYGPLKVIEPTRFHGDDASLE